MQQSDVIAFLSDPSSYPDKPHGIEQLATHGALVFLAGEHAWKIKRAVRFPYLDFSTLEKRHAACARELEINRRWAPEIYLGCVPITRGKSGALQFGGDGVTVEWAVHMRRFDQSAMLDAIARVQGIEAELATSLADCVFASHQSAEARPRGDGAERVRRVALSVSETLMALDGVLKPEKTSAFAERVHAELAAAEEILNVRASAGFVRRCHGDLHLRNIVLWNGKPTLFDALEFDENLATIDTLYDLAFLLMDLDKSAQRNAANIVLNRYIWRSGAELDLTGLRALPLFLGLRAAIRAMVTAERAVQQGSSEGAGNKLSARDYLDAANAYLSPSPPRLVAVGGLSGTGKSTVAAALAPGLGASPGAVHLRSDLERKSLFGVEATSRLEPDAYSRGTGEKVYAILYSKARLALAAGHAVITDAVFARPEERARIEAVADELGLPFQGLWLQAPAETLMNRVAARRGDASDATPDVVRQQLDYEIGALSGRWQRLDASGTLDQTVRSGKDKLELSQGSAAAKPSAM